MPGVACHRHVSVPGCFQHQSQPCPQPVHPEEGNMLQLCVPSLVRELPCPRAATATVGLWFISSVLTAEDTEAKECCGTFSCSPVPEWQRRDWNLGCVCRHLVGLPRGLKFSGKQSRDGSESAITAKACERVSEHVCARNLRAFLRLPLSLQGPPPTHSGLFYYAYECVSVWAGVQECSACRPEGASGPRELKLQVVVTPDVGAGN